MGWKVDKLVELLVEGLAVRDADARARILLLDRLIPAHLEPLVRRGIRVFDLRTRLSTSELGHHTPRVLRPRLGSALA